MHKKNPPLNNVCVGYKITNRQRHTAVNRSGYGQSTFTKAVCKPHITQLLHSITRTGTKTDNIRDNYRVELHATRGRSDSSTRIILYRACRHGDDGGNATPTCNRKKSQPFWHGKLQLIRTRRCTTRAPLEVFANSRK